jgi:hypothetical protein
VRREEREGGRCAGRSVSGRESRVSSTVDLTRGKADPSTAGPPCIGEKRRATTTQESAGSLS